MSNKCYNNCLWIQDFLFANWLLMNSLNATAFILLNWFLMNALSNSFNLVVDFIITLMHIHRQKEKKTELTNKCKQHLSTSFYNKQSKKQTSFYNKIRMVATNFYKTLTYVNLHTRKIQKNFLLLLCDRNATLFLSTKINDWIKQSKTIET